MSKSEVMKKPGIYITKTYGTIWLVEEIEYYPKSMVQDYKGFSIVIKGVVNGDQFANRCLIKQSQFKQFVYVGEL